MASKTNPHVFFVGHKQHCRGYLLGPAVLMSCWTGLSNKSLDMPIQQEAGLACPSRWTHLVTAWTSPFGILLGNHVREPLGQVSPRTHWTCWSKHIIDAPQPQLPCALTQSILWHNHSDMLKSLVTTQYLFATQCFGFLLLPFNSCS